MEIGAEDEARDLLGRIPQHLIDIIGPEGDTLLHLACLYGHASCASVLLDHGASVAVRDEDDSTVLHDACASGCVFAVKSPFSAQLMCLTGTSGPVGRRLHVRLLLA